ncbi:PAQR family membrane homeostasis protein TrhA [Clostridium sp. 'White wine YQ']|uniref:PAQR family membrane homeostasis protein TrhA n=1 Tax=Clostridium sp. 'White wine YQ' TaxID=3027474 RepID=UPI0023654F51|nr:hemolysin III family protein [Clostridium sp. 'White wine YQ']MDD7795961.1 hemolysin III family protein [Clostridium sp. 'White wine YQ']
MEKYFREPINGFTHLFGAVASLIGLIFMLIKVSINGASALSITAIAIFGASMILLYSASATYHMVKASDKVISFLRKLDHSMIFVLIAGSYTPFCLIALNGVQGWVLFSIIMSIAVIGIIFKMIWFNCPRWLSTLIYILMGWIAVFAIVPLYSAISLNGVLLLVLGGVLYTVGGLIYAIKPKILTFKYLGFHEIFHIFILLGTLAHFFCIFKYVI